MTPKRVDDAPNKILVVRLDRLGDVVLSTPVIAALRKRYPKAKIAMMVRSECRELVETHPSLDQVIVYEKESVHRGGWATLRFAWALRQQAFDTALVLHPSNRSHWIAWLSGIPVRIGYDRKWGCLLTHRLPHVKQEGDKHEAQYSLDMLRVLGIQESDPHPSIGLKPEACVSLEKKLLHAGLAVTEQWVAIHPSASCPSKRWMPERFAAVADQLIEKHGVAVCLVAGGSDRKIAEQVQQGMNQKVYNFSGMLTVGELAVLLSKSRLLLSNDSGPVHIAAALGTPVIDIFGRNQAGLSPKRWGPLGQGNIILHKDVGCDTCLAHACEIDFKCLTALTVDEVYTASQQLLAGCD